MEVVFSDVAEDGDEEESCMHRYVAFQGGRDQGITLSDCGVTKKSLQLHIMILVLN